MTFGRNEHAIVHGGNIFKLGTRYSEPMRATYADRNGSLTSMVIGCYGIGITRTLACVIEDNHDEKGIVFPESVAPYRYHLVQIGTDAEISELAERLYTQLGAERVLYDDRDVTPRVKFSDADLLGMPHRITVSRRALAAGGVELTCRRTGVSKIVAPDAVDR
ncbi:His/Gly/Thr/Pro-type tRNA ligase C-terminal domain-containing protein [Alicyclobacillus acidiphilus]|uniref:His/Gly/Thr/Pro-type tRNA ligase C-terminal domain-containing protein n=1 Tax=Alicyclobacillus acidiphilus TaxID=182455 RepID=UPI000B1356BE|nr:His/Gly/Thr/Pro-type tRNA ligase C-terminal domain-containing protein [Alicyclobacillus acidiphilus]